MAEAPLPLQLPPPIPLVSGAEGRRAQTMRAVLRAGRLHCAHAHRVEIVVMR
jgi:hypothetical protein